MSSLSSETRTSLLIPCSSSFSVPPGPPTPWIVDTGKDSVIVAWKPPLYNGGGDILGYHVEKVETFSPADVAFVL